MRAKCRKTIATIKSEEQVSYYYKFLFHHSKNESLFTIIIWIAPLIISSFLIHYFLVQSYLVHLNTLVTILLILPIVHITTFFNSEIVISKHLEPLTYNDLIYDDLPTKTFQMLTESIHTTTSNLKEISEITEQELRIQRNLKITSEKMGNFSNTVMVSNQEHTNAFKELIQGLASINDNTNYILNEATINKETASSLRERSKSLKESISFFQLQD